MPDTRTDGRIPNVHLLEMRFFRYQATSQDGRRVEGSIRAIDAMGARAALNQAGYRDVHIEGDADAPPAHRQNTPPQTSAASRQSAPQPPPTTGPHQATKPSRKPLSRSSSVQSSGPIIITRTPTSSMPTTPNSSTPSNPKGQIKTKIGTDKDRLFLFAQFAAILNAGLNPAQAFHDVANRTAPHYKASVLALADAATNGTDLASVMEEYPDLYPEDVVGITRAGQVGGFLGDAFQEVSRQAESSHKFRRWFFWVWFVFLNALIGIPGMLWGTQALVRGWELIDKNGGQGGFSEALRSMGRSYLELLGWPFGPGFAALCLALLFLSKAFPSRRTKRLRHRLGLQFPVYGPRARHENLARFSWVMDRLSRAGLAPARSYALAAECVPNLEMRDRLKEVADRLDGAEKMSDIFTGAKLFPEEYAAIVATAEYTGDLPRAFEQITRASEAEFQTAQNYAKARSGCWGMLGCFITSAAMIGILWWVWYHQLPAKILEGFE